jgi:hypothetical protein
MKNVTTQKGELSPGLKGLLFILSMTLVSANNAYSTVKLYVQYLISHINFTHKHTHARNLYNFYEQIFKTCAEN